MRARCWYHCSCEHHEESWTAVRRAPVYRGSEEPATPRLCVAPSVAQALAAAWWRDGVGVGVYVTPERRTVPPAGVWDAVVTGERWIIPPVTLHRVGIIPAHAIEQAQEGLSPLSRGQTWDRMTQRLLNMTLVVAEHLPQARERWVESFALQVRDHFAGRRDHDVLRRGLELAAEVPPDAQEEVQPQEAHAD